MPSPRSRHQMFAAFLAAGLALSLPAAVLAEGEHQRRRGALAGLEVDPAAAAVELVAGGVAGDRHQLVGAQLAAEIDV